MYTFIGEDNRTMPIYLIKTLTFKDKTYKLFSPKQTEELQKSVNFQKGGYTKNDSN